MFVLTEMPHFSCQFGYDLGMCFVVPVLDAIYLQTHSTGFSVFIILFRFVRKWTAILRMVRSPSVSTLER